MPSFSSPKSWYCTGAARNFYLYICLHHVTMLLELYHLIMSHMIDGPSNSPPICVQPLSSDKRYYIRHDDMVYYRVVDGNVDKTKVQRLFMFNDLLVCTSAINRCNFNCHSIIIYDHKFLLGPQ